ncbi:acyltransferase family protein [Paraburkholderia heleia]|uniref:acyltransferase n=1 Tax=Paraburkholderia heleia TaxID=634127 RepID=UPI0005AA9056|nr:acyltransferase [Paraburkholderia heleia]
MTSHVAYTMFFAGAFTFGASKWIVPHLWHGVALALTLYLTSGTAHVIAFYLFVIWAILFVGGLQWLGRLVRPRNDVSYGVYIYGWPSAQIILLTVTAHMSPYILAALSLCLAGFFAALSWRLIEKPSITMGRHIASLNFRGWIRFLCGARMIEDIYAKRVFGSMCALLVVCVLMQHITYSHAFVPVTNMAMKIRAFGPTEGKAGVPLNVQPDGSSAMWISVDSVPQEGATVVFAGRRLVTALGKDVVTATVDQNLVAHAGEKPIFIERRLLDHVERSNAVAMNITQ